MTEPHRAAVVAIGHSDGGAVVGGWEVVMDRFPDVGHGDNGGISAIVMTGRRAMRRWRREERKEKKGGGGGSLH